MRFINGVIAAFLATAPLAAYAQCDDSATCAISDWACDRLCEMRGHTKGGSCEPRDGCKGQKVCACYQGSKKRNDNTIDGDAYVEETVSKEEFDDAVENEEPVVGRSLDKRSFCCSFLPPMAGLCCEKSCQEAGHPEGGQCSADNVCTCG